MIDDPMLSIAMATYNGERFLREQLDSVLAQIVTDFEVIVCDDCSTDGTAAVLEEYARRDKRFKIYRNTHNIGFKKNFEQAIGLCKGDYIALCDQDDIWYPDHLELLLKNIGDCVMCCGNSELVDADNRSLGRNMSDSDGIHFILGDKHKWLFRVMLHGSPFQGASMLLTAGFARQCVPIPDCMSYHDVWIAGLACMTETGLNYIMQPVTRYRQHAENVTLGQYRDRKRTLKEKVDDYIGKIWNKNLMKTNRYAMSEELGKRCLEYNQKVGNPYYARIALFLKHSQAKRLDWRDMVFLWRNISYITTTKKKRGVIRKWYVWTHSVAE